jgi:hypothetical protein
MEFVMLVKLVPKNQQLAKDNKHNVYLEIFVFLEHASQ